MPDPKRRKGSRHDQPPAELLNAVRTSRATQLELQRTTEREILIAASTGSEVFRFVLEDIAREFAPLSEAQRQSILYRVLWPYGYEWVAKAKRAIAELTPREAAHA